MPDTVLRRRSQDIVSSLNAHRILVYSLVSTIAVCFAIANSLRLQSNFYSVTIHLSKSNRSVLILVNFGFLVALLCAHIAQQIFFGPLRAPEIERLYDRLWFFVTESLLAFTIFRDDFDVLFALMFGFLLFIKSFHWLAADRIEWMDQRPYPGPPPLFHFRMSALFILLWGIDCLMFLIAAEHTLTHGVSGMVMFASEYAILMATALNAIAKYVLSLYEIRRASQRGGENAPPWENKSMWTFYIELSTDFLKLTTYLIFFAVIITFYGLPLNIIRDVYVTARSFITRLRALHRYQTATRNMDQRYPNATPEELAAMSDRTCIICREEMSTGPNQDPQRAPDGQAPVPTSEGPNTTPKKLPCGHIFHFNCLRSWLERQQNCPTCRRTVLDVHPQGQQAPAAGAPAPLQPGHLPQQPVQIGVAGLQPAQQPPNNPAGFFGRMLGFAHQPVIVPGQFAQVPGVNVNQIRNYYNVPLLPGQVPQGVVIQYHIQVQPQRQPQPPPPQTQPQMPTQAPLPRFAGFQGPAGGWQPWGMDHRWFLPENAVQTPEPPVTSSSATPPRSSDQTPSTSTADGTMAPRNRATPDQTTSAGQSSSMGPTVSMAGDPSPFANQTPVALPAMNAESGEHPIPSPHGETLPSTTSPSNTASQSGKPRFNVPPLVPLYDYRPASASQALPQYFNAWQRGYGPPVHNAQAYPPGPSIQTQLPGHQAQSRPAMSHFPTAGARPRTPFHQMPPNLTDEQLALMDHLTREAIDERLRVLEGVSGAVFRCIDELLRMRSVLPQSSAVTGTGRPSAPQAPDREPPTTSGISQMAPLAAVVPPPSELAPKKSDQEKDKVPPVREMSADAPIEGGQPQ